VLVFGILASLIGAARWDSYAVGQQRQHLDTTTNTVAATLSAYLQRDEDLVDVIRATTATGTTTTNAQLEQLFSTIGPNRYPGIVGLAYVEKVAPGSLKAFDKQVTQDPPLGQPLTEAPTLTPAGARPYYCLTRLIAASRASIATSVAQPKSIGAALVPLLNPGFDYCDSAFNRLLQSASSSDSAEVARMVPLLEASIPGWSKTGAAAFVSNLVEVAVPVYATGQPTATAQERESATVGWAAGLIDPQQATAPILESVNGLSIVLTYANPTGTVSRIVTAGQPSAKQITRAVPLTLSGRWSAVIGLPPETASPTVQALGVLDIALILTVLLFVLLLRLAAGRARALQLAEDTTVELRHRILHDPLTDLPNRDLVFDRADRMLARAKRDRMPLACFYVDLDNFTAINESLGHRVGDQLLRAIAERLQTTMRASDTLGRVAADQFVVLADSISINEGPDPIARKLLSAFNEPFAGARPGQPLHVSASIGVAWGHRETAAELIRDAGIAVNEAKAQGSGRCVYFEPAMHTAARGRLDLELDLRLAVEQNQFFVVYQPVFRLGDMALSGVEALLRWQHPVRGVVEPTSFISHLEQTGMIITVGRQVLFQACRDAVEWHRRNVPLRVAVNASAHQLATDEYRREVEESLRTSGLEPRFLTIEVTESVLMDDAEAAIRRLHALKALGVRIAIDDFGTGYSSLSYLRQFPVDVLKIDRSFVSASHDPQGRALLRTMVQLGHSMGVETVAEGIETESELRILQAEGCASGQGYLMARPMGKDVLWEHLSRPRQSRPREGAAAPAG
jgi:diguanylate cyclase (GGDEF)-like protein